MSAHFTQRRNAFAAINQKSQLPTITRPHSTDAEASVFQVILIAICVLLLLAFMLCLVYSYLKHFQWFGNLIDPDSCMDHNAEQAERSEFMAGHEIGVSARESGRVLSPERPLLCDRFGYLGGSREYGWWLRASGDGNVENREASTGADADNGYQIIGENDFDRSSTGSSKSIKHRDDCAGQCGLTSRRGSRSPSPK